MLTFSDFILFLYEKKCLVNYFDNLKNICYLGCKDDIKSKVKVLMECHPVDYLQGAFVWERSKENHDFWSAINNKWLCFIDNER